MDALLSTGQDLSDGDCLGSFIPRVAPLAMDDKARVSSDFRYYS